MKEVFKSYPMNYINSSHILSKANNCYYAVLDDKLKLQTANGKLINLFSKKQPQGTGLFLDLFAKRFQKQWNNVFDGLQYAEENLETVTIPAETEQGDLYIDWNICALLSDENAIEGFEILGVPSKKAPSEKGLANTGTDGNTKNITENIVPQTALTRYQRRFKSVLDELKKILDSSLDMICVFDGSGTFTRVSKSSEAILGFQPRELIGKNFLEFVYEVDKPKTIETNDKIKNGIITTNFENRYYKKDGSLATLAWSSKWEEEDQKFYCIARNVTDKKVSEAAIKASEEKYKVIFNNHPFPMFIYNIDSYMVIEVNEAAVTHYGFSGEEFLNMKISDFLEDEEVKRFYSYYQVRENHYTPGKGIWTHKKKNGELFFAEVTANFIEFQGIEAKLVLAIDRTDQLNAEKELARINERYEFLSQATYDAIWDLDLKTNQVEWSEGVKKMFPIEYLSVINKMNGLLNNLHDEDRERVEAKLFNHFNQKESHWEDEYRFKTGENTYKYISARGYTIYDEHQIPLRMIGAMQDLTESKAHENMLQQLNFNLEKRAKELSESNAELERFAYVASHDLQEPLRMVSSFLQLLEKRYKDKLDHKAHEYIAYAVDGAERMKRLILDLLEYSRVNSSIIEKEDVDINEVIDDLKVMYKNTLLETHGTINHGELPLVKGNKTQILQLFQNLIGNAFKYRSDKYPVIDISCKEDNNSYKFSVSDNGLGIEPKFFQKIFIIFQRLHNREQYSGTGIGLAICKKIIDKHGGKIWVTSVPGQGSTFHFTIPRIK